MSDVVVVGAGIAGASAAYALARAGVTTTIVDRDQDLGTASLHNPGGLNPLHGPGIPGALAPFAMASFRLHAEHHEALRELSGVDVGFRRVQRLSLALDATDLTDRAELEARYDAADGFEARWLDGDALRQLVPGLGPDVEGGLMTWGNGRIDAVACTRAVNVACDRLGATRLGAEVLGVRAGGGRVTALVTDSGTVPCGAVVMATGAWATGPSSWLGLALPVRPVQGELLRMRLDGGPLGCDLSWRSAAFYELPGGDLLVGGTELDAGAEARPTAAAQGAILRAAGRIVPPVIGATLLGHEAGLRPGTPDDLPILGRAPGWDNVFLAMGGGRKGMLLSTGMGRAVASLVTGAESGLDLEPFSPDRFSRRTAASALDAVAAAWGAR